MIPDFKTYLKESIWSDMQERGTGDLLKKEDDVNLMDQYQFAEYLSGRYKITSKIKSSGINYLKSENELYVPILSKGSGWNSLLTMEYGRKKGVNFGSSVVNDFPEFYQQMNDNFILNKERRKRFTSWYIYPKDGGKINNSFFVTVLDFIISTGYKYLIISKNLKESIWSDMQERGTGDIDKKEDSVNLMSVDKFVKYLIKRYDFKDNYQIECDKDMFSIPVLCADGVFGHDNMGVDYIKDSSEIKYIWILDSALPGSVRSALKKRFELSVGNSYTFLSPLDGGELTNQFVVDVLDYMADLNMNDINIMRSVKESIWSDMQERGTGDIVKSEDDINLFDIDALYDYIMLHYEGKDENDIAYQMASRIRYSIVICVLDGHRNLHDFVNLYYTLKPDSNDEKQVAILPDVEQKYPDVYQALKQKYDIYYTVEYNNRRQTLLGIAPKDGGEQSNRFFLEVLDFIIGLNNEYTEVKKVK